MDPDTFMKIFIALPCICAYISLVVLLVGRCCFTPERVLRKVYPYIKQSGNDMVIFGFIIKKYTMVFHWYYTMYVIAWILAIVLFNTFLTVSYKYNPYDGLDCFGYYNGSEFEVTSEEQAESENVTGILCFGWKVDIAGGIGHAAAILTLSWIFSSIVLWIRLKLYYKAKISIKKGKRTLGYGCGLVGLAALQIIVFIASIAILTGLFYVTKISISFEQLLDFQLFSMILLSGVLIFPKQKKPKSLADCCKEAVENKEGKQEGDLVPIRNKLERKVQGHQSHVDLLLELAELECKKAVADMYYHGIKEDIIKNKLIHRCITILSIHPCPCTCMNTEDEEDEDTDTISRKEMKIIAQVAYGKVTGDLPQQNNDQGNDANPAELQQLIIDTSAGDDQVDESAGLLEHTRNKTTYIQLQ